MQTLPNNQSGAGKVSQNVGFLDAADVGLSMGVSKSSMGVDASSATSSVADGELSVDAMRIAPIYNNQSVPGYEECAGGSGHDVVWERGKGEAEGGKRRESTLGEMVGDKTSGGGVARGGSST